MSSLKNNAFIAGLARNQDTRSQGFPGAAFDGGLGIDSAADNYDVATVGVSVGVGGYLGEEGSEVGDGDRRGAVELAEGGRGGGEFEEGADGGVGQGQAQNGTVERKGDKSVILQRTQTVTTSIFFSFLCSKFG